jgi:hypothetical protein
VKRIFSISTKKKMEIKKETSVDSLLLKWNGLKSKAIIEARSAVCQADTCLMGISKLPLHHLDNDLPIK